MLSCSDSRVPVEVIFDQGLGDLFVVRVAGNVAATDEIGSMEYAVDHLGTPLVVVLGHSQCGAVSAVVEGAKLPGSIGALVAPIKPAVTKAKEENLGAAAEVVIAAAIKNNVYQAMEDILQKSPLIKAQVKAGKLKLLGAIYELDTGQVQWLGALPGQEKLLSGKAPAKWSRRAKAGRMNNPGRPGSRNRWGEFKPAAVVRSPGWRSRVAPLLMAGFLLMALMLPAAPVQAASADLTLTEKDSGRIGDLEGG